MTLDLKKADELQTSMEASWAATNNLIPKLTSGSAIKAIFFAIVLTVMWLQSLIRKTYLFARAATCFGDDLDSWMNDFNFPRLPAQSATGQVRLFLTNTSVSPTSIPVTGTVVQTLDGTIQYQLIPDTTLSAYDPVSNAYIIPANQLFCDAAVQATVIGSVDNVQAGALVQFTAPSNANSVINLDPILTGEDKESDAEYKARFIVDINSRSKATRMAILSAIVNTQQGMQAVLIENVDSILQPERGNFLAVINPASGVTNSALLAKTYQRIDAARGFCIGFGLIGALQNSVSIALAVRTDPNAASQAAILVAVKNAILDYVELLPVGASLTIAGLVFVAMGVPGVVDVQLTPTQSPKINGQEADFLPSRIGVVRTAANQITIGTF